MTNIAQLYEQRVLTNIRLTTHQMTILAMILASPEGNVPEEDISHGPNLTTARTLLTKLGLITQDADNRFSVNPQGVEIAKDENIVDDTGQLTELGNQLAYPDEKSPPGSPGPTGPADDPPSAAFAGASTEVGLPGPSESTNASQFILLKQLTEDAKLVEQF
jgi:hypothetical protein